MFEKCGMNDILFGIWKKKWLIVAVVLAFALLGAAYWGMEKSENSFAEDLLSPSNAQWVASSSFTVVGENPGGNTSGSGEGSAENSAAQSVLTLALADYRREVMLDALLEKYTPQEIIEALDLSTSPEKLSLFSLKDVVNGSVIPDSSVLNLFIHCNDESFARDFMTLINQSVQTVASDMGGCTVTYMGGVFALDPDASSQDRTGGTVSLPARMFLFAFIGFLLTALVVIAKAVFVPTVNRRADFSAYGLPVLGEVTVKKEGK